MNVFLLAFRKKGQKRKGDLIGHWKKSLMNHPLLVCNDGKGEMIRAKWTSVDNNEHKGLGKIFPKCILWIWLSTDVHFALVISPFPLLVDVTHQ